MLDCPGTGNLCTPASQNSVCKDSKTISLLSLPRVIRIKQDSQALGTESNNRIKKSKQMLKWNRRSGSRMSNRFV